jgi:hypothetical protein
MSARVGVPGGHEGGGGGCSMSRRSPGGCNKQTRNGDLVITDGVQRTTHTRHLRNATERVGWWQQPRGCRGSPKGQRVVSRLPRVALESTEQGVRKV